MKIYRQFLMFLAVAALASCGKNIDDIPNNEIEIPLDPNKQYIQFDAEIPTRGALVVGNTLAQDFNVLGYQYRGTWESESILASPNVFFSTLQIPQIPQEVEYKSGIFTYEPLQAWTGNKYSFFGYVPTDDTLFDIFGYVPTNLKLFDNGDAKTGEPYITYTLPPTTSHDPTQLIDIMTAAYIDTSLSASASVTLPMKHRLAAIDVSARNHYDYDHDSDSSTPDIEATIEITHLNVILDNVVNKAAKIYLNPDKDIATTKASDAEKQRTYQVVGAETWAPDTFDIAPNTSTDGAMRVIYNEDNTLSMLLIPQEELVTGSLELRYKIKYKDSNGNWVKLDETTPNADELKINFNKSLNEGSRYFIEITFTSDAVSVSVVAADEWDPTPDVNHDFE